MKKIVAAVVMMVLMSVSTANLVFAEEYKAEVAKKEWRHTNRNEGLEEFSKITPETYAKMKRADEDVIQKYLNKYIYTCFSNREVCIHDSLIGDKRLYNPSMILYKKKPTLVFTAENGKLMYLPLPIENENVKADIEDEAEMAYETAHCVVKQNEILIRSKDTGAIKYDKAKGKIEFWYNNDYYEHLSGRVPKNSAYCGYSSTLGYLFRDNADVYVYRQNSVINNERKIIIPIAHNVKSVLCSNYSYDGRSRNFPMFLMNDGTIKIYVPDIEKINADENAKLDLEEYLLNVVSEGGYAEIYRE